MMIITIIILKDIGQPVPLFLSMLVENDWKAEREGDQSNRTTTAWTQSPTSTSTSKRSKAINDGNTMMTAKGTAGRAGGEGGPDSVVRQTVITWSRLGGYKGCVVMYFNLEAELWQWLAMTGFISLIANIRIIIVISIFLFNNSQTDTVVGCCDSIRRRILANRMHTSTLTTQG